MKKTVTALTLALVAGGAFANTEPTSYWVSSNGHVVKDGFGGCVKTVNWKAEDEYICTGEKVAEPVAAAPAPAPMYQNVEQSLTVYFPNDVAKVSAANQARLAEFAGNMNSTMKDVSGVMVSGHASSPGSDGYNMRLSQRRANNVVSELNKLGVRNATVNSYGETDLVYTANGKEDQERSRRVVIDVTGQKQVQ
ncbi:OmpA family protein [Pokkaliibacter sp. CJK22405]|uniref:OmpA family protein n=1 Tax=Pokkaliibacter sp. CJK22405 TaxID=3384615 RepID=UPI003984E9D0